MENGSSENSASIDALATSPSVSMTVSPSDIAPGGSTTITLDASDHNKIEFNDLWTDWQITSIDPDGGMTSTALGDTADTGTVTVEWESLSQSSQPSITVDLPDHYIGGTYRLSGIATDDTTAAETTATLSISDSSGFQQQVKLTADDGDRSDYFGKSIAMTADGSTALIAAYRDEDPNGTDAGSVYVFSQSSGSWQQETKLYADDGGEYDYFGISVAVSDDGSIAIIGSRDEEPNGSYAGAAYVFTQSNGSWQQQTKLSANDGDKEDEFGRSVAMTADGSTAIIGADSDEDPNGTDAGSAYVFTQSNGSWQQETKLSASDGDSGDQFGQSTEIAADGSTAIIGAPNVGADVGAAYVFTQSNGSWQQETKLSAEDGDSDDWFGTSIGIADNGNTAIIGAENDEDPNGEENRVGAGSAYVFTQSNGSWQQETKLSASDGDGGDSFGKSIAVAPDGSTAIIGANRDDDPNGDFAGSAYVFTLSNGSWQQETKLSASDGDSNDDFGAEVTISSDSSTAIIGAYADEDPNGSVAGSAYVFK